MSEYLPDRGIGGSLCLSFLTFERDISAMDLCASLSSANLRSVYNEHDSLLRRRSKPPLPHSPVKTNVCD
ncbi:MAG TPA: hypothetical protein VHS31_02145 [Tepidisphaeraceae bacterium]|nr:hypothetical protein [Tepidisphaeraceae bacterium]